MSLIELMLAMAVIAVLAVIANSSYTSYVNRARTAAAKSDILMMSEKIFHYWSNNNAYPADLSAIGLAGAVDPWGRPYTYYNIAANGKGGARKDHALNPINKDFDFYSNGPDGKSKPQITQKDSVDDIIRARDGQFVGVAADF